MGNDECLACHSDVTLTKDENGKQINLHVDDAKFKASVHSVFGCIDCHTDVKAFPARSRSSQAGVCYLSRRPANGL